MKPTTITVCQGPSCKRNFSDDVLKTCTDKLRLQPGESMQSPDVTLATAKCMTNCQHGPSVAFDEHLLSQVSPKDMNYLIKLLKRGETAQLDGLLNEGKTLERLIP